MSGVGMALGVSCSPRGRVMSWTLRPLALQASVSLSQEAPGLAVQSGSSHPHVLGAGPACDLVICFLSDLSPRTTSWEPRGQALWFPLPSASSTGSWTAGLVPVMSP